MQSLRPDTPEQLAEALGSAAAAGKSITLGGAFTKDKMAGPVAPSDVRISTAGLNRVLQYEPQDLTISVEAGISYRELTRILKENRQMLPLDPPFSDDATIGGILAANSCGPRRRLHGTARDLVIGMKLATLEGTVVQSGGMVVKNVAGLDMCKLMIGSFGTLAAIAVANFKLQPTPLDSRTFLLAHDSAAAAIATRDRVLRGVLQPAAIDLVNPPASTRLGRDGYLLIVQVGGNAAVLKRYERELGDAQGMEAEQESSLWRRIQNYTPDFLADHPDAAVVRVSGALSQVGEVVETMQAPAVVRAGSGVCYGYFKDYNAAEAWAREASLRGWKVVIEFAPEAQKQKLALWPAPGSDFEIMKKVKQMFDPGNLLNRGRLYGRI
jgi:glycolate oxidase FAD binding subunit